MRAGGGAAAADGAWNDGHNQNEEQRMTMTRKSICAGLGMGILVLGLSACEKKEGPAERAGKQIDKAVENAGQQVEKAGQQIQDAAKDAKK